MTFLSFSTLICMPSLLFQSIFELGRCILRTAMYTVILPNGSIHVLKTKENVNYVIRNLCKAPSRLHQMFGSQRRPCERTPWRLMHTVEHKRGSQVPAVVSSHRRYLSQNRKRFAKLSQNRKIVVNFSSCTDSGEGENPGRGCGVWWAGTEAAENQWKKRR